MTAAKADIINRLRKELLPLQGFNAGLQNAALDDMLGPVKFAFPNNSFPLGAVHEFCYDGNEDAAATSGFVAGILSSLMKKGGAAIWISASGNIFPPALKSYGISPDKIIFIRLQKEKEMLWAMEEALKCEGLAAVIGEIPALNFTASRRLQLAVEESRVTGFLLRQHPLVAGSTACVTRWKINSVASHLAEGMPGVGFTRWNAALLKVRNGKPGSWQLEWAAGKFRHITATNTLVIPEQRKAV